MDALWSGSIDGWTEPAPARGRSRSPRSGEERRRGARPPEPDTSRAGPEATPVEEGGDDVRPRRGPGDLRPPAGPATADHGPAEGDPADPPPPPALPVEVIRSTKRKRTVGARIVDGRIVVRVPHRLSKADTEEAVAALVARLERQRSSTQVDLAERARVLAARYDLPEPDRIRWVSNQQSRWGSCTPSSRDIRISDRIAGFPTWVVDAVIVHELAHLVHADHSPAFWALAHRYPKTERALGFLIAKDLTEDDAGQM